MPLHNEVPLLRTITEDYVCSHFMNICCDNIDFMKEVKKFADEYINENIKQQMLQNVLGGMYTIDFSSAYLMLILLGSNKTRSIDLTRCGKVDAENLGSLCDSILKLSSPSTNMVGFSCHIKALSQARQMFDSSVTLILAIDNMPNLTHLILQGVGDTELLTVIGVSCRKLESLDVSNSPFIEDDSIAALLIRDPKEITNTNVTQLMNYKGTLNPLCKTLRLFGLFGTNVGYPGIILSLYVIRNLESFGGHIASCSITKSIHSMYLYEQNINFNIAYIWDYCITEEQSKALSATCPSLISICTNAHSLVTLIDAPCLKQLTIKCDYHDIDRYLYSYLEQKGNHLTTLRVKRLTNSFLDIAEISRFCPNLKELECPLKCRNGSLMQRWTEMEYANIEVSSLKCLQTFVHNAPNLKNMKLSFDRYSCDNSNETNTIFIKNLLKDGAFKNLESLCIYKLNLTIDDLNIIIEFCPNISYIGKLSQWFNVSKSEIEVIRKKLKTANWDISIEI